MMIVKMSNQLYTAIGEQRIKNSLPSQVSDRLSHPYYWAPFILIGNGL
jgi:CHAT domain-containing protein